MKALATQDAGVLVHASTLGALEALLQFLRDECKPPIPVSNITIGPIHKKDVMRANIMNEKVSVGNLKQEVLLSTALSVAKL